MAAPLALMLGSAPKLSASASPALLTGFTVGTGTVVTKFSATCTALGGSPGYTYSWTYVSGDASIGPIDAASASTKFSGYFTSIGTYSAVFKCVVTDAAATVVASNEITVTLDCT